MATASSTDPVETSDPTYLERMGGLALAQQGRAMADIAADRCLLRRQAKASQNRYFGLPQENLPECEDDMGVQVGDNTDNSKVIHNHYHGPTNPTDPDPIQPCPPPTGRRPWWMIAALVLPWVALVFLLVWWVLVNWPQPSPPGTEPDPILWRMDIETENPPEPEPKSEPEPPAGESN